MSKPRKVDLAKELRRKQTEAERVLWKRLRSSQLKGVKFRRQEPIGNYIVDLVTFDKKLIIELDGGQHNDELVAKNDEQRAKWLEAEGFRIMRFWNNDVLLNTDGVLTVILEALK